MQTSESQIEAIRRYEARTYKRLTFNFRLEEDAEILESLEKAREQGLNKTEWLRGVFYKPPIKAEIPDDLVSLEAVEETLYAFRTPNVENIIEELQRKSRA